MKTFISDSSPLEIDIVYKENLVGRCTEFILKPLSFEVYFEFKDMKIDLERIKLNQKDFEMELNIFYSKNQ